MSRSDGGGSSEKDDLATVEGNIALGLQMYSYWRSEGKHFLGNQRAAESLVDQAANDCASKYVQPISYKISTSYCTPLQNLHFY